MPGFFLGIKKCGQCDFFIYNQNTFVGRLAQLARASALHAEGQGFESLNVHHRLVVCELPTKVGSFFTFIFAIQNFAVIISSLWVVSSVG